MSKEIKKTNLLLLGLGTYVDSLFLCGYNA